VVPEAALTGAHGSLLRSEFLSHPSVIITTMNTQLLLIDDRSPDWRLDDKTREAGRKGLAEARAALQKAVQRVAA
jgi:hypothetical protein